MSTADSKVTDMNIPQIIECSSVTLEILLCFFAFDHSPDSRMILILQTIPILLRRFQRQIIEVLPLLENRSLVAPICDEMFLRSLRIGRFRQEEFPREQVELSSPFSKNFYQVALVDRALHFHFSTLEETKMDHNPVNSLILTFPQVAPFYRQEHIFQDLDIHTRSFPGLMKLKKTRTKAFLRSNSS